MEADGFQADTEEEDEEDCVIVSTIKDSGKSHYVDIPMMDNPLYERLFSIKFGNI